MSLRTKILGLFLAMMLIPMLVVSVGNYVQAMRSFRGLIDAKLEAAGDRTATSIETLGRDMRQRMARAAASPAITRLVEGTGAGSGVPDAADVEAALSTLATSLGHTFVSLSYNETGRTPVTIPAPQAGSTAPPAGCGDPSLAWLEIAEPVVPRGVTESRGELVGRIPVSASIPSETMFAWFGRNGQQLVVGRETGTVVFDGRCAAGLDRPVRGPVQAWSWDDPRSGRGRVTLVEDGIEKSGTFIDIASLPLRVVTVADMEEFVGPYRSEQLLYLGFVMFIVVAAGGGFVILAQETMGSLRELTVASERIGAGELMPWLPPPGPDEVGRLSQSFSLMLGRLKAMMRQNEIARRLAVAGEVTAQLSHEIRNPLSSIRLNLQSLDREIRDGAVPSDLPQVLRLCLREINRLDEAVSSVLELGQPKPPEFVPCRLNAIVAESLRIVEPRFRARRIELMFERRTECDRVLADEGQLKGAFLNLFLNAIDAMPDGGRLDVWTDCEPDGAGGIEARVHIVDSGTGVRPEIRSLIFEPFFTTKPGGSGIGLSMTAQTVAAHGGRLVLANAADDGGGAHFEVRLPARPVGANANDGAGLDDDRAIARGGPRRPATRLMERTEG